MLPPDRVFDHMVTALVPTLSKSLAEQFNVFRVMRHGTHEKQLSNVFAWLLDADGTHELGDVFQQLFIARVNAARADGEKLALSGYRVSQEVDTSGDAALGKDIADIVLRSDEAGIVIENFGTSDGHGHDYFAYLAHGAQDNRSSVVVLLCVRHEPGLQTGGWEHATVLTYAELLDDLRTHIAGDVRWRRNHPKQNFFMNELVEQFVEGPGVVSTEDRIAFITTMCATGEFVRYGYVPHDAAAQEFAELVAQHAKKQFLDGRRTLSDVKRALKRYSKQHLQRQINERAQHTLIESVRTPFAGKWEWFVWLRDANESINAGLVFGPTAATYHEALQQPNDRPDFSKVFVRVKLDGEPVVERLIQTDVGLDEVIAGLSPDDQRLADSVMSAMRWSEVTRSDVDQA